MANQENREESRPQQDSFRARRRTMRRRRIKKLARMLPVIVLLAALLAAAVWVIAPMIGGTSAQEENDAQNNLCEVYVGDITQSVFASGSVMPQSQPGVYAKADGRVSQIRVEMGDEVRKGDVIAVLENDALHTERAQMEYDLRVAQNTVEDEKTYEPFRYRQLHWEDGRPRMDVDTGEPLKAKYSNELSIRAPGPGRIMAVYIKPGDDALAVYREKGAVIVISTDGRMRVELDDVPSGMLELGDTVRVIGDGVDAEGVVENLVRRGTQATIVIIGDDYDEIDIPVAVQTKDGRPLGDSVLEVNKPLYVSAYGGIIRTVGARVGQYVEDDEPLARFTGASIPLYIENASVMREYAVAMATLEDTLDKINALTITAPCDGKVVGVDTSLDADVVDGDLLLTLVEDAGMQIVLSVDELDIAQVKPGQRVRMTLDALGGVTLDGTVEKIAPLGNTETSVTTYDVYISAETVDERVKGGMNVSGEIEIASQKDALLIHTDALFKDADGYYVHMEDGSVRRVKTGVVTVESAQILSGLQEGERVVY